MGCMQSAVALNDPRCCLIPRLPLQMLAILQQAMETQLLKSRQRQQMARDTAL